MDVDRSGVAYLELQIERLGSGVEQALKNVSKDIADDVVNLARSRVPRVSGRAASTYRTTMGEHGAEVSLGGSRAPYVPWLEFGGVAGRSGASRPYVPGGRYLYPAIRRVTEGWEEEIMRGLDGLSDLDVS